MSILLTRLLATGFYTGYTPIAPGTAGSLLALVLYWVIPGSQSVYFGIVMLGLTVAGAWSASVIEKESGIEDDQIIVIDEIVGMMLTVFAFEKKIIWLVVGFVLFRLFDIIKPAPARQAEKIKNGWGVMLDDIVAGIYAAVSLRLLYFFFG